MESDDRELAKSALFAIPTIQGNYLILPNEKQDESELNLELLFNATLPSLHTSTPYEARSISNSPPSPYGKDS